MDHSMRFSETLRGLYLLPPEVNNSIDSKFRHSFNDWYLIPKERYSIIPPEVKSNIIEIPGADGGLDLSESLTGYPVYSNREDSFDFYIADDKTIRNKYTGLDNLYQGETTTWYEIYRDICNFLNGRQMYLLLEDDPRFYYYGRFTVGKYNSGNGKFSEIKISYNLEPYRILPWKTDNDWYWDALYVRNTSPLATGENVYNTGDQFKNPYQDIFINDGTEVSKTFICGPMSVVPKIHVALIVTQEVTNPTVTIQAINESIHLNYTQTYLSTNVEVTEKTVGGITYNVKEFDIYDRNIIFAYSRNGTNELKLTMNGWISLDYEIGVL